VMRDEQRVALITHLAIPDGFRSAELAKYDHAGKTFQSMNQKMTTFMAGQDHALVALLQLHCDQGMNSAQDMVRSSVTDKDVFLGAHPEVAKRYADDQAFKEGFDAMLWAHGKGRRRIQTDQRRPFRSRCSLWCGGRLFQGVTMSPYRLAEVRVEEPPIKRRANRRALVVGLVIMIAVGIGWSVAMPIATLPIMMFAVFMAYTIAYHNSSRARLRREAAVAARAEELVRAMDNLTR